MSLPLGVWLSPGATERGLLYQRRVSTALDAALPIMAQAAGQQMRPDPRDDAMRRFREIEQRLQPAARGPERPVRAPRAPMEPRRLGREGRRQEGMPLGPAEPGGGERPGLTRMLESIMQLAGQVAGGPELEEAFRPAPYGLAPPLPLPFDRFRQSLISEGGFTPEQARDTMRYHSLLNMGLAEQDASSRLYEEKYGEPLAPPTMPEPYPAGDERARERYEALYPEGRELRPQGLWFDPEQGRFTTGLAPLTGAGRGPLHGIEETLLEQPIPLAPPASQAAELAEEAGAPRLRPTVGETMEAAGRFQKRFLDPQAALALQLAETSPEIALVQQYVHEPLAEKAGIPEAWRPGLEYGVPKPGEIVNPFAAWMGDEKEQAKVQGVLEEAGLPNALAAQVLTDPFWLVPGMGITKVRSFTNLIRQAGRLKGAARARILNRPVVRRTVEAIMSEAGGGRVPGGRLRPTPPEGMQLINDIPTTTAIRQRLAEIDATLAKPKVKGGRASMLTERARVQAQADIDDILASGRPVDDQFDALTRELGELQTEARFRSVPFRGRARYGRGPKPEYGPEFKEAQYGKPSAARRREAAEAVRYERYPELSGTELDARERVFREFVDNARFEPAPEPLVGRARFTPEGERVREPTFATEAEIQGYRAEQGRLGMGAGEQPIETAGPMFERPVEAAGMPPPRKPPVPGDLPPREPPRPPEPPAPGVPDESGHIPTLREVEADAFPRLTPEERARFVPETRGVYAPDEFEEVATRILSGADPAVMAFAEKLVRIPGVKQIVGVINRIAEARGNPILMARIKNGIFKAIEGNRADTAVLRWKKEMMDAFEWGPKWTAKVELRSGIKGVPEKAKGHIEDLLVHTDDYILTDAQRAALNHGRGLRDNVLRQQLTNGVDILPVEQEYMRRIVTATPEGKVRNGVIARGARIGGHKGSQKPRTFKDIRDGFRANYDYERDPFSLMGLRLREGVETIADKRTMRLVATEGETVAERVPTHLREEAVSARQGLVEARRVASRKGAPVADKTAWEVARRDYVQARRVWQEVRRRVAEPGWGEVRGPGNRIFEEQFAKELTEWTASGSESVVQQANLLVRAFKTTLDISATGVQLGLTALSHPLIWSKATVRGILSALADPLSWAHANYGALDEAIKYGAAAKPTEFLFARTGLSSIPTRIPYLGSLFRGSNRAFQWAVIQAQTDLWRIHRMGLTSVDDLASAAASIRKQTGALESAALGLGSKQRALESTIAFAARFFRANVGLIADLGMRGPRGRIARETLGRFFVAGTTLTIGFNMVLNGGKLPNLTDPHKPGWFKVRIGEDSYVSVFGPFYPFMRLVAQDADLLAQGKITEIYKPLAWFAQSKAGIPYRTAYDLYLASRGQKTNVFGDRLPTTPEGAAEFVSRQFAPIGVEQAAEGVTAGRPEAAMEMAGINVTPVSPYQRLIEGWERERGNRNIPDVSFDEAGDPFKIAEQDPQLAPLVQAVYGRGQRRGTPGAQRAETIQEVRLGLEENTGLLKAAQDIEAGVPGAKAEFAYAFDQYSTQMVGANEVVYRGMVRDPDSEEGKRLQAYYDIEMTDFPNPDGPGFDRNAFYAAKDAAFENLSSQLQGAMEEDIKSINPFVQRYEPEYRKARQLRSQAHDMPRHQGVSAEEEREAREFRSLVDQARDRIAGAGLDPGDVTIQQYLAVAEDNGVSPKVAYLAFALRPNSKGEISLRDIRYTEFLIKNSEVLAPYFPSFYPRRMLPALEPEIWEEVIAAGVR